MLAGWNSSKISKIEYGKQTPTEDDIRVWCHHCQEPDQVPDLIATVRNIEAMYTEWRRVLRVGTKRRQQASISLEAHTRLFRWYEPFLVPGILHTAEYATAAMVQVIDFYETPDDLTDGVAARMERQQILYKGNHRFHFILAQQALLTTTVIVVVKIHHVGQGTSVAEADGDHGGDEDVLADGDVVADDDDRAAVGLDGGAAADRDAIAEDHLSAFVELDEEIGGQVTVTTDGEGFAVPLR